MHRSQELQAKLFSLDDELGGVARKPIPEGAAPPDASSPQPVDQSGMTGLVTGFDGKVIGRRMPDGSILPLTEEEVSAEVGLQRSGSSKTAGRRRKKGGAERDGEEGSTDAATEPNIMERAGSFVGGLLGTAK